MNAIGLMIRGLAMGIAEVIPGVSGGTIAFISGIYERLINSIKAIGPEAVSAWKKGGLKEVWNAIDGTFLLFLVAGMGIGFIAGVFVITQLMESHPQVLWGFFFGLIAASSILVALEVKSWDWRKIAALIIGTIVAFWITIAAPAEGSLNPIYVYFSAVIAISALMLPGISGSFVLLIMGMYTLIIPTIKRMLTTFEVDAMITVAIFGFGALTGLALFSRVLSWLFANYKEVSFALLTGFMIGSLNKIWPWRNISSIMNKENGEILNFESLGILDFDKEQFKILSESNVMPSNYTMGEPMTLLVIAFLLIGILIVYLLHKYNVKRS